MIIGFSFISNFETNFANILCAMHSAILRSSIIELWYFKPHALMRRNTVGDDVRFFYVYDR